MIASFYPCLVAGTALIFFGGYHLTIGRLIRKFVGNRFGVEINRRDEITFSEASQGKATRIMIVYYGLYWIGLLTVMVLGGALIVVILSVGNVLSYSGPK